MTVSAFQQSNGIIGKSKEIKDLLDVVVQVAQSDISVLILGESGTGKEVFARAIHNNSLRSSNKLVSVNCGAIPEGILESELFGHVKGAFTGAIDNRKGYFEIADGGTLFLDEIAEMPLTTQVKLLRVLETKEFMRIGGEKTTKVDVRIVAAANKNLQIEVDSKRFRSDLYFRLKAVTITIPPLRSRKIDIPVLAEYFLKEYASSANIVTPVLSQAALQIIMNYSWPGNVRELKNTMESAAALTKGSIIEAEVFEHLLSKDVRTSSEFLPVHLNKSSESIDRELIFGALIEIKKDLMELKRLASQYKQPNEFEESNSKMADVKPLKDLERESIINALNQTKWNKKKAANLLEISERTLFRKIKEYGLQ